MGKVTEERKAGSFAEGRDRANVTLIGMPAAERVRWGCCLPNGWDTRLSMWIL